jgi:uncharacterized phage-associated protein
MSNDAPASVQSLQPRGYSVRGLANWILDYAAELKLPVTNMALNKLVYFAYERSLIARGTILTNAKIEAWDHGPVFREVYQSFKSFADKPIISRASFFSVQSGALEESVADLSLDDAAFLRSALRDLIPLSASRLRELSHIEGGAWHQVWCYDGHANPGMEITPELILDLGNKDV